MREAETLLAETHIALFLTASVALIVATGPDNILVLTRGVAQGRGAALVSAASASLGLVVHSAFAAAGLSALLNQSVVAFSVVKYVGAAYLVYLGVRALLDRGRLAPARGEEPVGLRKVFVQAVVSDVMNPKIAVFFLAYLPQFADPASGGTASDCSCSASSSRCSP
jgi:threonine/homoserine/homoserine lactone efflux protein